MAFLASNGFDFNKLFTSGISTLNSKESEKLRQNLKERQANRAELKKSQQQQQVDETTQPAEKKPMTPVPERELNMLAEVRELIQSVADGKSPKVSIEKNGFQRKLIYEMIDSEFSSRVSTRSENAENNRKSLIVEPKKSAAEEQEIEMIKLKREEDELLLKLGLRLVMKEISSSQKLIVGHNCLYDLMFLHRQCFDEMPEDLGEFKKSITKTFPKILDTKFIASSDHFSEFSSTILNDVYRDVRDKKLLTDNDVEFESDEFSYKNVAKEHEAGYDSYITGCSFLGLLKHLKVEVNAEFDARCKQLQPFMNRLSIQKIQNHYLHLNGNEPTINKDHVFYITFPSTWRVIDIQNQFANYGHVQIFWVDSSSAYIALTQREMTTCLLKTITKLPGCEIQSFKDFKANKVETLKRKHSPEPKVETSKVDSGKTESAKKRKTSNGVFTESNDW